MVQLTTEQRVFVVKKFHDTKSLQAVQNAFREEFPQRDPPAKKTIWANVQKYGEYGTSQNRNKGNSGRRRTGRSEANIDVFFQSIKCVACNLRILFLFGYEPNSSGFSAHWVIIHQPAHLGI